MNPLKKITAITAILFAVLAGCQSSAYQPAGTDAQVSATAAKTVYPTTMESEPAPNLFYNVGSNNVITLYNPGNSGFINFTLWVNRNYSLIVDKLQPHTYRDILPSTVYNQNGVSVSSMQPGTVSTVQIMTNGHMYDLPGPVHPG